MQPRRPRTVFGSDLYEAEVRYQVEREWVMQAGRRNLAQDQGRAEFVAS